MSQAVRRGPTRGIRGGVGRITHVPAIGTLFSVLGVSHRYDYHRWFMGQRATPRQRAEQRRHRFPYAPLLSFVIPVYHPDPAVLRALLDAVQAQTYSRWQVCLANGDATNAAVRALLDAYARRDSRIHVRHLPENQGISGNSNAALAMASGDYVALVDHDDLIEPTYAYEVIAALNLYGPADVVYFDQDKVSADGKLFTSPEFKPAWSPDLLLTSPLPIHPVLKRKAVIAAGGFDPAMDGTQDWDLFLRLAESTSAAIHIPKVLYHWRTVAASAAASTDAKPYVYERQLAAITRHLQRLGRQEASATFVGHGYGAVRVTWQSRGSSASIIIPSLDDGPQLRASLDSLRARAGYENYTVAIVDRGSTQPETRQLYEAVAREPGVRVIQGERPLSLWEAYNLGARHTPGDVLVFLDCSLMAPDHGWLAELVRWAEVPEVGVVGAQILDASGKIAHAGLVFGLAGPVGPIFAHCDPATRNAIGSASWYRDYSAVGGGCQAIRRDLFTRLGGYDERFIASYADANLCLRVGDEGLRVLYTPFARFERMGMSVEATNHASLTSTQSDLEQDRAWALRQFASLLERGDPAFNPHLKLTDTTPRLDRSRSPYAVHASQAVAGTLSPFAPRVPLWVMARGTEIGAQE